MKSILRQINGRKYFEIDGQEVPYAEMYLKGAEMIEEMKNPSDNLPNAAPVCVMDWNELSDADKNTIGAQVLLYDAEDKRYIPIA